jgi:branched-subunit amino acid aminotransferase/4-amino-4-deoxychorismate lyase
MVKLFAIYHDFVQELSLSEMGSLDMVTRQLANGLYSTFRTYGGGRKVLGLEAHLGRLYGPFGGQISATAPELRGHLRALLRPFEESEARVRLVLVTTGGEAGQVFVAIEPLKLPGQDAYRLGVRAETTYVARIDPRLKSTVFIEKSEHERREMLSHGVFEALMVRRGRILEGLTSNFYAVKTGKIVTARDGILLGVTRRAVLRLARSNGVEIEYRPLHVDELPQIEEAFITSSSRGVVPVTNIDGQSVGKGVVGEVSALLGRAYDEYASKKAEKI